MKKHDLIVAFVEGPGHDDHEPFLPVTCRSAIALAPLILLIGAVELHAQRGSVVINEIMYSPFGENDPAGPQTEYVELYNRSGEVVDLTGWVLTDLDTSRRIGPKNFWPTTSQAGKKMRRRPVTKRRRKCGTASTLSRAN